MSQRHPFPMTPRDNDILHPLVCLLCFDNCIQLLPRESRQPLVGRVGVDPLAMTPPWIFNFFGYFIVVGPAKQLFQTVDVDSLLSVKQIGLHLFSSCPGAQLSIICFYDRPALLQWRSSRYMYRPPLKKRSRKKITDAVKQAVTTNLYTFQTHCQWQGQRYLLRQPWLQIFSWE
jgi:hypothetical protein